MDFYAAKAQLEEAERKRNLRFDEERKARIAADSATMIDKLIDKTYPRHKDLFWAGRRIIRDACSGWYYRKAKSRVQRALRGYGNIDLWNLNSYLDSWLPLALRELAGMHVGYPAVVYDYTGIELYKLDIEISEEDSKRCSDIWEKTLERMALGFDAHEVLSEHSWSMDTEAEQELRRIFKEGMLLLMYNFDALWD
jgi:hypothetical protein